MNLVINLTLLTILQASTAMQQQLPMTCQEPAAPSHGSFAWTTVSRVMFYCDFGFELVGKDHITCEHGEWVGSTPICIDLKGGRSSSLRWWWRRRWRRSLPRRRETTVVHKQLMQVSDISCLAGPHPVTPPPVSHATFQYTLRGNHLWVTYACKEGFITRGNRTIFCKNSNWIGKLPHCQKADPCTVNEGGCEHVCSSLEGRVFCSCNPGYRLAQNERDCQDIDECEEEMHNCAHHCLNLPGSYSCKCDSGYRLELDNQCSGCPMNTYMSGSRLTDCVPCPPNTHTVGTGKTNIADCVCDLGYDGDYSRGMNCQDADECSRTDNFLCEHLCVNTIGSAFCRCRVGYNLGLDGRSCFDINECGMANGGCAHRCVNTDGSFYCSCHKGYTSDPINPKLCVDEDECAVFNGGCDQECTNFPGGYLCSCRDTFFLHEDGRTCLDILCNSLIVPENGRLSCSDKESAARLIFKVGTTCEVTCKKGFRKNHASVRRCDVEGVWTGRDTTCVTRRSLECRPLEVGNHSSVLPMECSSGTVPIGSKCRYSCDDGYDMAGPANRRCRKGGKWRPNKPPPQCLLLAESQPQPGLEESGPTEMTCPEDVTANLTGSRSTVFLEHVPKPQTNADILEVEPNWAIDGAMFTYGDTVLTYKAHDTESQSVRTCTLTVHVIDVEPPTVVECPGNMEVIAGEEYPVRQEWLEPRFEDNVELAKVWQSHRPGSRFTAGKHTVRYTAEDRAGNVKDCSFAIHVMQDTCEMPTGPENGDSKCIRWMYGIFCEPECSTGHMFYQVAGPNVYMCGSDKKWYPQAHIPDCTPVRRYIPDEKCPSGYEVRADDYLCVACPRGYYLPPSASICAPCQLGSYQDEFASHDCIHCPDLHTTLEPAAHSQHQCIRIIENEN